MTYPTTATVAQIAAGTSFGGEELLIEMSYDESEVVVPGVGVYVSIDGESTWELERLDLVAGGVREKTGEAYFLASVYTYDPYGRVHGEKEITANLEDRWQSKRWDSEYEFYYFGARYFDSVLGLWNSPDPARQFANPYAYGGDPVNGRDPDGRLFIADSWVFGFTQRLIQTGSPTKAWNEANHRAVSDVKIWGGLFTVDTDLGIGGAAWQLISRFTWEAPSTILQHHGILPTN